MALVTRGKGDRPAFRGRTLIAAIAAVGLAAFGLGYCSDQFGLNESEEGRGVSSEVIFPASELETTLGLIAVQNAIELRVTHDVEVFGRTQDLYTDVYPAEVPGFLEFKIEDVPEVEVTRDGDEGEGGRDRDRVKVTINRDDVFVQERVEQLREPVSFTVVDGRISDEGGLPIESRTRVFLEDGTYTTGAFVFDPEGAESALTKIADGITLGLTDISSGTSENILKIAQLATLNPACIRAADEKVGLEQLIAGGIEDYLVRQGFDAERIEVEFTGEFPAYDEFPDETGATFQESLATVEESLAGNNKKTIEFSADCNSDAVIDPESTISLSSPTPTAPSD
ncbi:MAG TPA: hypothetical protein VFH36_00875 [Acidimicrobiales bacterium]|nr:hypothetical protein [Acidimicrobiales bacterium]